MDDDDTGYGICEKCHFDTRNKTIQEHERVVSGNWQARDMAYIKSLSYELCYDGYFAGTPVVKLELSGCNKVCAWCEVDHFDYEHVDNNDLLRRDTKFLWAKNKHVLITGGEPTLHEVYYFANMVQNRHTKKIIYETNGSDKARGSLWRKGNNWLSVIPSDINFRLTKGNELRIPAVPEFTSRGTLGYLGGLEFDHFYIYPVRIQHETDEQTLKRLKDAIRAVKLNPQWKLSLGRYFKDVVNGVGEK